MEVTSHSYLLVTLYFHNLFFMRDVTFWMHFSVCSYICFMAHFTMTWAPRRHGLCRPLLFLFPQGLECSKMLKDVLYKIFCNPAMIISSNKFLFWNSLSHSTHWFSNILAFVLLKIILTAKTFLSGIICQYVLCYKWKLKSFKYIII